MFLETIKAFVESNAMWIGLLGMVFAIVWKLLQTGLLNQEA